MEVSCSDKLNICCKVFEKRAHLEEAQPLAAEFFHEQIISYLLQKNTQILSAPEVDMICDLIWDAWDELQVFVEESPLGKIANLHGLFQSFHIDFPLVEKEPVIDFV